MLITDVQLKKGILDMYSTKLKRYTLPTGRKVVEPNPELKQFLKKLNSKGREYDIRYRNRKYKVI